MSEILEKLGLIGLVPVVKIEDASKAERLADALVAGGLPCAEVTFRTDAAADAISAITTAFPQMLVGAGTVINVDYAKKAKKAGARFIVSPGFNPAVVDWCLKNDMPVVPGVNNPSGVEAGLEKGLSVLKFFPAEQSGGVGMLSALAGPFPQVSFMPTGGISLKNLADYAKCANVHAIGGSWMVKSDLIESENWEEITRLCREAVTALHGFSLAHVGINGRDEQDAQNISKLLKACGFETKPDAGTCGHIELKCWNVERALYYLKQFGFNAVKETVKTEKGKISLAYLDKEIGGFAVQLVRAK